MSEVILAFIAIRDGAPPFSDLHCFFDPSLVIVRLRVYNIGLTPSYDLVRFGNMVRSLAEFQLAERDDKWTDLVIVSLLKFLRFVVVFIYAS